MNILITTPSLSHTDNVSGISSVVRLLLEYNRKDTYFPFILGKKDRQKRGLSWVSTLLKIPFRLVGLIKEKDIKLAHFNIGFEPYSLLRDVVPYGILSYKRIPLCLHIHGGRYMSRVPNNFVLKTILCFLLKKASQIIVLSDREADLLMLHYPFVLRNKLNIVSNAVEVSREINKNFEGVLNILFLGRIDRKKGLQTIAEVLNQLSNNQVPFNFYLCGVGDDKEWFFTLLSESALSSVIDKGLVFGQVKKEILEIAHIFLLPSFFEGLPMSLLESMGCAVLPIVTPVGSIPEVVQNGENGFLLKKAKDIVSAVSELEKNRQKLAKMAQQARKTIELQFSMKDYIKQINEIYSKI